MLRLLDLFCGAGGAGMGYHQAGFDVTGVDLAPQPRYPFVFQQADALAYLAEHGREFDVIHASPPCQAYSHLTPVARKEAHPRLIAAVREALRATGRPYVIENVGGAKHDLREPFMLCGTMFGLPTFRHRFFEAPDVFALLPPCDHAVLPLLVTTASRASRAKRAGLGLPAKSVRHAVQAYGIDWMTAAELAEAIPPAYTRWIGAQLRARLEGTSP